MNAITPGLLPRVLQPEPGDWHEDVFGRLDDPLLDQLRESREGGCGGWFPVDSLGPGECVSPGEDVGFLNRSGRAFSGLDSSYDFFEARGGTDRDAACHSAFDRRRVGETLECRGDWHDVLGLYGVQAGYLRNEPSPLQLREPLERAQ